MTNELNGRSAAGRDGAETLLQAASAPLCGWYAAPCTREQSARLRQAAQQAVQGRLRAGASGFQPRVALVCGAAAPADAAGRYRALLRAAAGRRERALLELVYGQWLAARKLHPAMRHLADGFRLAASWLDHREYFVLLRRHERLAGLALSPRPAPPQGLHALLREAAVTERLRGGVRRAGAHNPCDTLG